LIEHPKLYRFFTIFLFSPGKVRRYTTAKPDRLRGYADALAHIAVRAFKPAPSLKPRQTPKILAAHRYIFSVNALRPEV